MPLAHRLGGRRNTQQNNNNEEHQEEEHQAGGGEQGNGDQGGIGALMPSLQEIIAWLRPHVEEKKWNHGQEEGSHHRGTHMLD